MIRESLPVDGHIDQILDSVAKHGIVAVEAPPGTGKTTRVAPALMKLGERTNSSERLGSGKLGIGKKTYLVQPRRLAARAVAERIASEDGTQVGERIGYSVRFDHRVSKQTELIVATEGVLIRKLLSDPTLQDVGVVILDEFHERSLDADLLFGMLRRVQMELREDLRIVLMSATLDTELFAAELPEVPRIRVESQGYPVRIEYRPLEVGQSLIDHAANVTRQVVGRTQGDLLVFMPGASEIHRLIRAIESDRAVADCELVPLMGSMRLEEQSRAIQTGNRRRIVVATNIAETSLTIPGVRTVIDSGLARVLRFAPSMGLDRLELENISNASATQRAGRAGRVAPGLCVRLWSEASDRARSPFLEPEIRRIDLCSARLQLFAWGEGAGEGFPWLEVPRQDAWQAAGRVLEVLGAVDKDKITPMGLRMSQVPLHPRLSRMCIEAEDLGCFPQACVMGAMLSERDAFDRHDRGTSLTQQLRSWESDCVERLHWLQKAAEEKEQEKHEENDTTAGELYPSDVGVMQALLAGFPDRLAKRRNSGQPHGLMVGGKGVELSAQSGVRSSELFLCIDLEGQKTDALVRQASGVRAEWLMGKHLQSREEMFFHPTQKQVVGRRRMYWFDLCLQETPISISDEEQCAEVLFRAVISNWESVFPKDDAVVSQWIQRVR